MTDKENKREYDLRDIINKPNVRKYLIFGNNISLIKMTSEELLFKGLFNSLKVEIADE